MKITLEMAERYAHAADQLYNRLRIRLDTLKQLPVLGSPGSLGYSTVADVVAHLEMRAEQIDAMRTEIAELESTDEHSEQLCILIKRMGLQV